jgi:ATP-dependent helicase HepA
VTEASPGIAAFEVGQLVAVRADPARKGPVIAVLPPVGGRLRYRVFHSSSATREYAEDQLVAADMPAIDAWADQLVNGPWVDLEALQARLVASRLANPQMDHVYALHAGRIKFIPFQFKPLLRLLRSDRPRLLIADDVGVGKTIEAGLILKELTTRQRLDRVMVLCPKALTLKWRVEMRRFDEDFRILDARALRYCLDEARLEGQWPTEYTRAIVHYELARMEPYLDGADRSSGRHPGLLELDPSPQFDLVIADEAHHLRTPGTGSHRLMEFLCDVSEAVLMLTATPVQVSAENLFVLLSLLRPDLFPDLASFRDVTEPNPYITAAIRALRGGSALAHDWIAQAREALDAAESTPWGQSVLRGDASFARVRSAASASHLDDAERVRCIRDLEEAHSLAHVMNRTRRRDIGRFTVRDPRTVSVPFTPEQQAFYDEVLAFRRQVLLRRYAPQVVNLILDTLERQAASSITALAEGIERILSANGFARLTDDPDAPGLPDGGLMDLLSDAEALLEAGRRLPAEDPKFDRLLELTNETMGEVDGPGKVLVFSFFLHTLAYLERRLRAAGMRVKLLTGQTPDEEREALRDRFRLERADPRAIDILLSSEVGCEGLDYEFCDRLVNYDIPWNPMRLEQRIGRIDRFGQQSEKVLIFSFVTPGTVEDRVFYRCFERIGIFRDTVGDLEEVLGPMVQELTSIATSRDLSPEQAEQKARQVADNAIRLAEEQRRLDSESGGLLGLDDSFIAEVGDLVTSGRFVGASDLRRLVSSYLSSLPPRVTLHPAADGIYELRAISAGRDALAVGVRTLHRDRVVASFGNAVEAGDTHRLTFDHEVALANRSMDFVTPMHPLARLAVHHWTSEPDLLIGGLRLITNAISAGRYVFVCERWETISARPALQLECLLAAIDDGAPDDGAGRTLLGLLQEGEPIERAMLVESSELMTERLHGLVAHSDTTRRSAVAALTRANGALVDRRLASLRSFYDNRVSRVSTEHAAATDERIVRMKAAELVRIQAEYEQRKADLDRARNVEILSERVAAGYLEVVARGH